MGFVYRTGFGIALILLGGLLAHWHLPPFPALWSLKQSVYDGWQRRALLQRLQSFGYQPLESRFEGQPDPLLLRVSRQPDAPLLLDLHPWNNDWLELHESLFTRFAELDWHVVRPNFGGAVRVSSHCCSDAVIESIDDAVAMARAAGVSSQAPLLVLGESGGGMTAACWLAKGATQPRHVQMWVPVADLALWQRQTGFNHPELADDIQQCTRQGAEAATVSPIGLSYSDKLRTTRIEIFAGIHDGFAGTVPISHSVSLFQHLSGSLQGEPAVVASELLNRILVARTGDSAIYAALPPGRAVHLHRQAGNVSLTLFEGGHEMLQEAVIASFCREGTAGCDGRASYLPETD